MTKQDTTFRLLDVSTSLRPNKFAMVDADDYEWLAQFNWRIDKQGYVRCSARVDTGKQNIHIARYIMNPASDMVADHINGNPLDNRRCNLRVLSKRDNAINCCANQGREYKGTSKHTKSGYEAFIGVHGKRRYLGLFREIEQGAIAYDVAAVLLFGKRVAVTNFDSSPTLADLVKLWTEVHGIPEQTDMLGKRVDQSNKAA